jgi:hypothetical protein
MAYKQLQFDMFYSLNESIKFFGNIMNEKKEGYGILLEKNN